MVASITQIYKIKCFTTEINPMKELPLQVLVSIPNRHFIGMSSQGEYIFV